LLDQPLAFFLASILAKRKREIKTPMALVEAVIPRFKMLKRISYGLRNVEVYWRKMLLGFVPSRSYFHTI